MPWTLVLRTVNWDLRHHMTWTTRQHIHPSNHWGTCDTDFRSSQNGSCKILRKRIKIKKIKSFFCEILYFMLLCQREYTPYTKPHPVGWWRTFVNEARISMTSFSAFSFFLTLLGPLYIYHFCIRCWMWPLVKVLSAKIIKKSHEKEIISSSTCKSTLSA